MPDEFGIFALFIAVVGIFSVLSSGRYEMALLLPKKESEAMHILGLAFSINFAVSLMLLCMIVFFHDGLSELFDNSQMDFWLYFIPLTVFVVGLFNQLSIFNNRQKHYRDIAQASIVKSIVLVLVQLGMGFAKAGVSGLISGQINDHSGWDEFGFHRMRNLLASALFNQGVESENLSSVLGHTSPETLKQYLTMQRKEACRIIESAAMRLLKTGGKDPPI